MFYKYINADQHGFKNDILDDLLSRGYYRIFNKMFTTTSIDVYRVGNSTYIEPVFWLRTVVNKIKVNEHQQHKFRNCSRFTCTIIPLMMNKEIEELFTKYKNYINFDPGDIIEEYSVLNKIGNPFTSKMVLIMDKGKLIATGFFDEGSNSIMGLSNIYDPAYSKYSLGKFLMLKKIEYAIQNNIKYYYTGYIGLRSNKLDYKVFPNENVVEVYMPFHNEWKPFSLTDKSLLEIYYEENMFDEDIDL